MKKLFWLFLLMCNLIVIGSAQNNINIDSVISLLQSTKEDTAKVNLLGYLENFYSRVDKDSAFAYTQEKLLLSKKLNYRVGISESYLALGSWYYLQSNNQRALEYYYKALKLAEEIKDSLLIGSCYSGIGLILDAQKNYEEALTNFRKIFIYWSNPSKEYKAVLFANLAATFLKQNQLDSALHYAEESYQLFRTADDKTAMTSSLRTLTEVYFKLGNKILGEAYFKVGVENAMQTNNRRNLAALFRVAAAQFLNDGNKASALFYCKKALSIYQKLNIKSRMTEIYAFLTDIFKSRLQFDSAFFYQSKMVALKDSIVKENNLADIQNLNFEERVREQEKIAEEQKTKEERARNIQYSLIALGLISFLALFFLLSHSIIVNQKFIRFLGVVALLIVFEFINLYIHPYLSHITKDSPLLMLLVMVCIAALLVPLHHRIEYWITHRLVEKNKKIRLAAAKKTIAKLEG
jgi:tetratricopeptide (TPR) repeat protein